MLKKTQFNFNKNDFKQIKYLVFKKNKFWFTYNYNNDEKKILINKFMFEIIKKYLGANKYIFNILDNKNSTNDLDKIRKFLKKFNMSLKQISNLIDIPNEISQTWPKRYYEIFIEKKYNEWIMNL